MERKKILVVDDDPAVCVLVKAIIKKFGYEALIVTDGHQAIEKIQNDENIFLIITDINMPIMNGFTLIKKIQQHFPYLKIIAMTSDLENQLLLHKYQIYASVDKFDLYHSLTGILKKIERNDSVKDIGKSFGFTT
ncbi:MAG: response regulator [bacterium]|nr:response regulator [bacterium]